MVCLDEDATLVDSLGTVAHQRSFWRDKGLEADELERRLQVGVTADVARGVRALVHAPGLVLVHVDAHMEGFDPAIGFPPSATAC